MSEPTPPAAALCRSCNKEAADASGIGPACRARAEAMLTAMTDATRKTEEAAAKAAKAPKPSRAKAEAEVAGGRLRRDLDRLLGRPAEPPPSDEPAAPVPPVRMRVRVGGPPLVPPRAQTCCQCPRVKPFPDDPDNTAARCGECVRNNQASMRAFRNR